MLIFLEYSGNNFWHVKVMNPRQSMFLYLLSEMLKVKELFWSCKSETAQLEPTNFMGSNVLFGTDVFSVVIYGNIYTMQMKIQLWLNKHNLKIISCHKQIMSTNL